MVGQDLVCLINHPKHTALTSVTPEHALHLFHGGAPQIFIMEFPAKDSDQKSQRYSCLFILLQDSPRRRWHWSGAIPGVWTENRGRFSALLFHIFPSS